MNRDENGFLIVAALNDALSSVDDAQRHETLGRMLVEAFADNGYADPLLLAIETIDRIERVGLDAT
jgi:hypothetical protein